MSGGVSTAMISSGSVLGDGFQKIAFYSFIATLLKSLYEKHLHTPSLHWHFGTGLFQRIHVSVLSGELHVPLPDISDLVLSKL